ncbi:MAG: hypothetical protein IJ644_03725, partial [Oscillospiraceae bacterium]|nr:hypothetical protein [Oscillospiraceae bacterium]
MGEAFFYILGIILEVIVLTPLAGVATVGYCLIFCVKNYITAMAGNLKRVAFDPKSKEPAVENYCFGIGQKQAVQILKDTVSENFSVTLKDTLEFGKDRLDDSDLIAEKIIGLSVIICSSVFITVIASAMAGVAFALHFLLLSLVSLVIYLISGAANLTERLYLWAHKIFADCPVHKERFVVPAFLCPKCGKMHRKLIPNKYGIFHHTCACGNKLPS